MGYFELHYYINILTFLLNILHFAVWLQHSVSFPSPSYSHQVNNSAAVANVGSALGSCRPGVDGRSPVVTTSSDLRYRVTRRVFSEPVTSKLHILFPNIIAGHLKASEVTWISAMHSIFSHPPAHSGPISFSKVENLKLASGTNKSK